MQNIMSKIYGLPFSLNLLNNTIQASIILRVNSR